MHFGLSHSQSELVLTVVLRLKMLGTAWLTVEPPAIVQISQLMITVNKEPDTE